MALALYRRYRPDTFAEVIGQDQVTVPLSRALDEGRLTHAYLFSGPRGCGKTSSARILARCANCAKGPTSHPCGECDSCRDLATGGPGSLDVVEIDAASHNGVDDARELRERAGFAPARDRFKIFILDEAHMVTQQGFNALLKIVEEPPEHVMFIFATTEPDKVIGTIRSRTHHYPFRLVPPEVMGPYLRGICDREGITCDAGVMRMVMRAGAGSVRDTLSVLDQLMAGASGGSVDRDSAVALLGFTPDPLIGRAVDAVIASDGSALYDVVEKVVAGGFDPRRFVGDLLARVRDLLVLRLGGPEAERALGDETDGQGLDELRRQAGALGLDDWAALAGMLDAAIAGMVGTVSPRMKLELLAARLLSSRRGEASPASGAAPEKGEESVSGGGFVGASRRHSVVPPAQTSARASGHAAASADASGETAPVSASPATPSAVAASDAPGASQADPAQTPPDDVDGRWDAVVSALPGDIGGYVDRHHVPRVSLSSRPSGDGVLAMTFDCALSQHAFALAVAPGGVKAAHIVLDGVRAVFGDRMTIAPTPVAANGEKVEKTTRMPPEELSRIKQQIALDRARQAAGNLTVAAHGRRADDHAATGVRPAPSAHEGGSRSSDEGQTPDGDDVPVHRGPSPLTSSVDAVDQEEMDAWFMPVPTSSAGAVGAGETNHIVPGPAGSFGKAATSSPGARSRMTEFGRSDNPDGAADEHSDSSRPHHGDPRRAEATPRPGAVVPSPRGRGWSSPGPGFAEEPEPGSEPQEDIPDPEPPGEDDYSLDDRSLDDASEMSLEELSRMFGVQRIERYEDDDPRNPMNPGNPSTTDSLPANSGSGGDAGPTV
ncbi:DNA polymerase III subunit gamma/tau [uncultured Bifidobacterium sp.]|uniref:DNA polymerase III subunit gamma/tau n=1 Tax=uncultured Bifidobacterium sp. TaxID=165187 RepID=UPI0028DCB987|nr:DNA polymerase III subunit gamma/tau [uncultured Bifidobacterium sp.]